MPSPQARRGETGARSPRRHTNVERAWENSVLTGIQDDGREAVGMRLETEEIEGVDAIAVPFAALAA